MDLSKHTAAELKAIVWDVVQIDPERAGFLTENGQHISHGLYIAASRKLPEELQRERSAKGGRGEDTPDKVQAVGAISQLLISGARPSSIPAMCRDAGVGDVFERHGTTTIKRWIKQSPIWGQLEQTYKDALKRPGRRNN